MKFGVGSGGWRTGFRADKFSWQENWCPTEMKTQICPIFMNEENTDE
jgi:hypothetical protein